MKFDGPFDQEATPCPRCGRPVAWKWATDPHGGFLSEPHNVLVADCVFHAECWDAMIAEHPPGQAPAGEAGPP
jgi:hypothetical protein